VIIVFIENKENYIWQWDEVGNSCFILRRFVFQVYFRRTATATTSLVPFLFHFSLTISRLANFNPQVKKG